MYIFAYAVQPCIQTPDIAQCALRKKKELKEGGGAGVTDTCFLTKSLWQIGLNTHSITRQSLTWFYSQTQLPVSFPIHLVCS